MQKKTSRKRYNKGVIGKNTGNVRLKCVLVTGQPYKQKGRFFSVNDKRASDCILGHVYDEQITLK